MEGGGVRRKGSHMKEEVPYVGPVMLAKLSAVGSRRPVRPLSFASEGAVKMYTGATHAEVCPR